ncbi:alpha/beta fold hydrolase [Nocardiopsis sp. FR26]|uniref:alpha/beta hydrolase n=1 Tax=unclassified Nocardiopsis TaxID=2649073 RepID=UPI00351A4171
MLVLIPGGPQDAGVFAGLTEHLADRYTTVTYDPRGNSRSPLDGEPEEQRVDVHSDDAARLIAEVAGGPVRVFGNSAGAQVALDLASVHAVVAHEPPCVLMLEDPSEAMARGREVYETFTEEGAEAAMGEFLVLNGLEDSTWPGDEETRERVNGNLAYSFAHGLLPVTAYRPDADALRVPLAVGLGGESRGSAIHDIGLALVRRLGTEPAVFPGDHLGFGSRPAAFADTPHRALDGI